MRYWILVLSVLSSCFSVFCQTIDTISGTPFDSIPTIQGSIAPPKVFKERIIKLENNSANQSLQLDEMLSQESALHLRQYGSGQLTSISMRGANAAQTNVYWNGVLLNSPMLGQADLSIIPLIGVDEAAIRYGYANQRDGFGGLGGSILLSSAKESNPLKLTVGIGSYNDYSLGGVGSYALTRWKLKTGISYRSAENDFKFSNISKPENPIESRGNNNFLQYSLQQHAWLKSNRGAEWSLHGLYTAANRQIPNTISSQLNSDQTQDDYTALVSLAYQKQHSNWFVKSQAAYRFMELEYENPQSQIHSNSTMHGFQWTNYAKRYIGEKNKVEANLLLNVDQAFASTYAQEVRTQGRLGLQYTRFISEYWRIYAGLQPEFIDDTIVATLPVLGVTRDLLKKQVTLKGNIARNMRFPTLNDLYWNPGGNPNLKPELGWNAELGLSWNKNYSTWLFSGEITGFIGEIDQWILWVPNSEGFTEVQNVDKVNQQGVELGVVIVKRILKDWKTSFRADYTFVQSTNQDGNQLIYTPKNELNYRVQITYLNWMLKGGYHYTDERFVNSNNSWFLPAYDLVDLSIAYTFKTKHKWDGTVQVQSSNLLNKSYMSLAGRPMPGRVYQLTVQIRWK